MTAFGPDEPRIDSGGLLAWLAGTGCLEVAFHLDKDVVNSEEVVLGLSAGSGSLTTAQVRRLLADPNGATDVVALTLAEYVSRQQLQVRRLLQGLPLF